MKHTALDAARTATWIRRHEAQPHRAQWHAAHLHAPDPHDEHLYATAYETAREWPPELALRWAVLEQALADVGNPGKPHRRESAERWFNMGDENAHPFSFHAICEALGLDALATRGIVRRVLKGELILPGAHRSARVLAYLRQQAQPMTAKEIGFALRLKEHEVTGTLSGLLRLHHGPLVERVGPARYRAVRGGG